MVFFLFRDCDRGACGALGATVVGGRRREQPKAKKQGVCRLTGGRADDHVRKEISFPSEKTEKAVYTISLVAQSARSEAGKCRQLFLMRWDFAGSNPCIPKRNGDAGGGFAEQSA